MTTKGTRATIYENWIDSDKVEGIATLLSLVSTDRFVVNGHDLQSETWVVCFDGDNWESTYQRTILV